VDEEYAGVIKLPDGRWAVANRQNVSGLTQDDLLGMLHAFRLWWTVLWDLRGPIGHVPLDQELGHETTYAVPVMFRTADLNVALNEIQLRLNSGNAGLRPAVMPQDAWKVYAGED